MDRLERILRISKKGASTGDFLKGVVIRCLRMEKFLEDILIGTIHDVV